MTIESTFSYRARDASGEVVSGTVMASSADEVGRQLRSDGKIVLEIDDRPLRGASGLDASQIRLNEAARRVGRDDVIAFCEQLSVMLDTGVPLAEALDAFYEQSGSKEFRAVIEVLRQDIYSGKTFSEAAMKWPRVFPRIMTSLLKASEASGTLALMLGRVASYLGKERRTARQIKGALSYPLFMMLTALALSVFLMVFILPRFASVYEGRSAALPGITRALLGASEFMTSQYMYYVPALLAVIVSVAVGSRTARGRLWLDRLKLGLPVVGTMFSKLYITRASRTMATLLHAGVSLIDVIAICRGVTNNSAFDRLWDQMELDVREGRRLADSVARSPYIPANVASMVASGERSGRLDEVMERIAEFSEHELDDAVKQVTSYIEPVMVICMGVLVGGVAIALLLPIFKMGSVMAGN